MLAAVPLIAALVPGLAILCVVLFVLWCLYQSMDFEGMDAQERPPFGPYKPPYTDVFGEKNFRGFTNWLTDGMPGLISRSTLLDPSSYPWWIWIALAIYLFRREIVEIFKK